MRSRRQTPSHRSPASRRTAFRLFVCHAAFGLATALPAAPATSPAGDRGRKLTPPEPIVSTRDDPPNRIKAPADWAPRKTDLKRRHLELLRDQHKPAKRPPLDLQVHESTVVDGLYERRLVSYAVEADERGHAYLGIPLKAARPVPAVVALHGTSDT